MAASSTPYLPDAVMQRLSLVLIVAAMSLGGCDGSQSAAQISFRTAETAYAPGSEVAVRLENQSDITVGYNICFASIELERQDGGWEIVPASLGPNEPSGCTDELRMLAPTETAESRAFLPARLAAGRYRLATGVEVRTDRGGYDRERVVTNPFEVE